MGRATKDPGKRLPFTDVLVVIPGIMGSTLHDRHGNEVWGQGSGLLHGVLRGGIRRLTLPEDLGDEAPDDGVVPVSLVRGIHASLGVWSVSLGYSGLCRHLRNRYTLTPYDATVSERPANLLLFPYDWRLSNRYNGRRLKQIAEPFLERWRERSGHSDARLVILAHSMGGLVARWYAEHEGGAGRIRRLVTTGTPHRGSVQAVDRLVNGLREKVGPIGIDLSALARSLPSLYQLLPGYACVEVAGRLRTLCEVGGLPGLRNAPVDDGAKFQSQLATLPTYPFQPVVGIDQPTKASVRLNACGATLRRTMLTPDGTRLDRGGDGTVARFAAYPPGFGDLNTALHFAGQTHGALPGHRSVLEHIDGVLTGTTTEFRGGEFRLGVDVDDYALAGQPLRARAESDDHGVRLAVRVIDPAEGTAVAFEPMIAQGDGRYAVDLEDLPPGGYEVCVGRAHREGYLTNVVASATVVIDPDDTEGDE